MPKRNKGGKKSAGVEYCRGYVDEHGQWNNGFYCPQWGGPGRKYCCGTDTHRVCCPKEQPVLRHAGTFLDHLPLILGLSIGCLVVFVILTSVICYFCQGCWVYRRRKRIQHGGSTCSSQPATGGRTPDYAVSYSVCPHPPYMPDGLGHTVCYPLDDPPPYPGDSLHSMDEKQPLNPSHLYVAMDTPDDLLLCAAATRRDHAQHTSDVTSARREDGGIHGDDVTGLPHSASAMAVIVRDTSGGDNREDPGILGNGGESEFSKRSRAAAAASSPQRTGMTGKATQPPVPAPLPAAGASKVVCSSSTSFSPTSCAFLRGRIHDVIGDDMGEPQQTTKLLGEGSEDAPNENETGEEDDDDDDDVTDHDDDDDDDDEGTSEMTSCPDDNNVSLDDCTVQIIPQG